MNPTLTDGMTELPWPKAVKRKCATCSKPLVQREREGNAKFSKRRFCSMLCASKATGWRARYKDEG